MIIILEGNECNFKTTVANRLSEEFNYPVVKGSSFEQAKCTSDELFVNFARLLFDHDNVVFDRYIYSNLVYADIFKDYAILSQEDKVRIEEMLSKREHIVIYLYANTDTLKSRIKERGDDYINESDLDRLNKKYTSVIGESKCNILGFNTDVYDSDYIVKDILSYVKNKQKEYLDENS